MADTTNGDTSIVRNAAGRIYLDSGMTEAVFGRTNLTVKLQENGYMAETEFTDFTSSNSGFKFTPWKFEGTSLLPEKNNHVFLYGNLDVVTDRPLRTMKSLLFSSDTDRFFATFSVVRLLTQIIAEKRQIPICGAEGILFGVDKEKKRITILLLPEELFESAAANYSSGQYADFQGRWICKGLGNRDAAGFLRSVLVYFCLTGKFPYAPADTDARQADIIDRNFVPAENMINGITGELAGAINNGLSIGPVNRKKQKTVLQESFPLSLFAAEIGLQPDGTCIPVKHETGISDTNFESLREKTYRKQQRRIKNSRTIRKNSVLLGICLVTVVLIIIAALNLHSTNLDKPTSVGLTAAQTVQAFYEGIHTLNIDLLDAVSEGKAAGGYSDSVSAVFVSAKTREAYEHLGNIRTPEQWLYYLKSGDPLLYGITQFRLDNQPAPLTVTVPKRRDNPQPVLLQDSHKIQDGDTISHQVSYYLLHSEGEKSDVFVTKYRARLTLTYKKDRWVITNISTDESSDIPVKSEEFKNEYRKAVGENPSISDYVNATKTMSTRYGWLPELTAVKAAGEEIQHQLAQQQ